MTDREQIEQEISKFISAYNAANLDGVMACYADDLIKTRQGAPAENKSQTAARLKITMGQFHGHLSVTNEEIVVVGEIAYVRGSLTVLLTPHAVGEPQQRVARRFLEIWQKRNGRWQVTRTMDNMG